ncbi:hypothetical protein AAP_00719 [Ascosphaera apis ARSEF 7405]|uniref:Uncharacterized protein n=1 Tax=Ascosphaera apis ARSEF 7405 TaxID=392613 RepID=A0A168CW29_9EURO|nr:hypothetical protein AAP_00719 [Ascosphaera apis ARSEF 7405]
MGLPLTLFIITTTTTVIIIILIIMIARDLCGDHTLRKRGAEDSSGEEDQRILLLLPRTALLARTRQGPGKDRAGNIHELQHAQS